MANDENKIILEFPATNVEIEFGETITFDNISGFLDSGRVTYNGDSLTEIITHLEDDKADTTYVNTELGKKMNKANPVGTGSFSFNRREGSTVGDKSVALGDRTIASGANSFASGYGSVASGAKSTAMGNGNRASGNSSMAINSSNTASGDYSLAQGGLCEAGEYCSHAEGYSAKASGYVSHAEGQGTIANHISQHASGEFNIPDDSSNPEYSRGKYVEIVGNGTSDNNRSNARTLDWQGNEMIAGDLTYNGNKTLTGEISRLDERITDLPEAMVFKGTLGVGGTIETLPTASASNEGWMFKCITAGTYAGLTLKVGDTVTCFNPPNTSNYYWDKTGSQDTDTDTWRNIKVNGVEKLGNGISSGAVDFVGSENIEVEFDTNGNKVGIKTKNIYTKNEVDDIVYNILPDDTASGSVANFETDLALPLKSLEIDVNAKQDLHGYDYPWTAGGGKNILLKPFVHYSLAPNNLEDMFFIKAGDYRFSFSDSTAENWRVGMRMKDAEGNDLTDIAYKPNSGMSWRSTINCWLGGSDSTTKSTSITIVEDCYIRMVFGLASTTADTEFTDVQLEKGTTQTSYEPVENICPIEGWSEVYLKRCKKNWLDKDTAPIVNGYITATDFNTSNYKSRTTYIKIPAGSTFTVTKIASARFTLATAKNPPASGELLTNRLATYSQATKLTITAGSEDRYLWIWFYLYDTDTETYEDVLNSIQVELGSTETEYEPYVGNEYIINLGGTYYGGHFTQDKAGHRQLTVTHELKHLKDLNVRYSNNSGAWASWLFFVGVDDKKQGQPIKCTHYETVTINNVGNLDNLKATAPTWSNYFYWRDDTYTSADDFIQNAPDITILVELATPYTINLPDGEPIITLNGTNNIYADTGDTSVVFKSSVNDYVSAHSGGGGLRSLGNSNENLSKGGGGSEEEPDEEENTEKTKLDETKVEVKEIGDDSNIKKLGGE